ncbi:metallophosphoesterase [Pseudomonas aeruginosa]|nr:metallophosphoesterase [Pseudomonas aeruginosa]
MSQSFEPVFRSANGYYLELGPNQEGRDFVIGDIHGEHEKLQELLAKARIQLGSDRIFFAGDLVDRGPMPFQVLGMLRKPGVFSVLGNHDVWCIEGGLIGEPAGHYKYGGKWFYELRDVERKAVAECLIQLPYALSFIGPDGKKYGLVHADCPSYRWDYFKETLCGEWGASMTDKAITEAIWSRTRFEDRDTSIVRGVEKVFVGHNVTDEVTELGNVVHLDTGGCFEGRRLTMLELKPAGGWVVHQA